MIKISDYPILEQNISTLKETSKDQHENGKPSYMTESTFPAVDFDKVKETYVRPLGLQEIPRSNDALLVDGENCVFVEFKNGCVDGAKKYEVRKKIYDSSLIFSDIISKGISWMRSYVEYVLVYNEKANPTAVKERNSYVQPSASFDEFAKTVSGLAKKEYVGFGVNIFKNYCFKDVHTYTEREFEEYLKKLSIC